MFARTSLSILLIGLVLVGRVCAQEASVRVTAGADPMATTVGEPIVLTVRVEGAPATVVQTPGRPVTVNLDPQQRAPRMQRFRFTEGDTERPGVAFSWQFRPRRAGTARIQPVTVVVRGEEYKTSPIQVEVTPSTGRPSGPTLTTPDGAPGTTLDERDLFVRATATADRAYQNEQVVVEYRLFYRPGVRLRHSRLADSWDAPGFWREELNVASRPTPQTQRANGQMYETVVLKRVALFPTRPGTLRVDPLRIETEAQGTVQMQRGGPALRGRFQPVRLASQSLSLRVRPLPSSAPSSFDGAVGQFSMRVRTDADSAAVGDPVSLKVRVQGTGNLATLSPPRLDPPATVEVYETVAESDIERNGRRMRGTKTFAYTLVPRSGGRLALSPVVFAYFDPEAGRYKTLRAEGPVLQVSGEAAPGEQQLSGRTGDGLPVGDVTGLMSADAVRWVRTDQRPLHRQPWAYLVLLLPVLLAGGAVLYRRRRQATGPTRRMESDASFEPAQAQLRAARRRLKKADGTAVYEAVGQALRTFLGGRLGQDSPPAPRSVLDRELRRHDVPGDLRDRLYEVLDRCDEAQYAPGSATPSAREDLLSDAHAVLDRLDEHLPPPVSHPERS